jgi:hypothetical protein
LRSAVMFHVKHRRWAGVVLGLGLVLASGRAQAEDEAPGAQINGGLQLGVVGQGSGKFWQETLFHGGLRGDVLWGRHRPFSWGVGPMVGVSTNHFRDVNVAGGLSVLVPVHEYLPVVIQAGPYARFQDGTHPGAFGTIFWGARSFNYHGNYSPAGGLVVEARVGLDEQKERALIVAAHLDLEVITLPIQFLINVFRLGRRPGSAPSPRAQHGGSEGIASCIGGASLQPLSGLRCKPATRIHDARAVTLGTPTPRVGAGGLSPRTAGRSRRRARGRGGAGPRSRGRRGERAEGGGR